MAATSHQGTRTHPSTQAGPFRIREIRYAPDYRQSPHEHDHTSVTLVFAGAIRETVRGQDALGTSLSVVVKPAGVRHADVVSPDGASTIQIAIADGWLADCCDEGTHLGDWRWLAAPPVSRLFLRLLAELRRGGRVATVHDTTLDILGGLSARDGASGPSPPSWIRRVQERLHDGCVDADSVAALAHEAGVHPVSLTRAFRRYLGTSVTGYRRRLRVQRAAGAIAAADHPLSRIAHETGYADHAHLCREFGRATGWTPSAFRKLARSTQGVGFTERPV